MLPSLKVDSFRGQAAFVLWAHFPHFNSKAPLPRAQALNFFGTTEANPRMLR